MSEPEPTHQAEPDAIVAHPSTQWLRRAVASALLCVFANGVAASTFVDQSLSYRYGTAFKEPGVAAGGDIGKSILALQHFSTDRLGSHFLNVDALLSHTEDPANESSRGATEFYAIYRRDWSLSRLLSTELSGWILRDVALRMGGDLNTKDSAFAPRKRLLVFGPQLQFAVPRGFFNVACNYSREWNHNGIVGENVHFDPAFAVEAAWGLPFHLLGASWKFAGFFNYVAPKGRDGFGARTRAEILTRSELTFDAGEIAGYEYWRNKFGNDHARVPGSLARTPMLIATTHIRP